MDAPCAVKPNCADVDLNEPCVFDYGILGRNMQHMQLKRWANRVKVSLLYGILNGDEAYLIPTWLMREQGWHR